MTLKRAHGSPAILGLNQDMVYGPSVAAEKEVVMAPDCGVCFLTLWGAPMFASSVSKLGCKLRFQAVLRCVSEPWRLPRYLITSGALGYMLVAGAFSMEAPKPVVPGQVRETCGGGDVLQLLCTYIRNGRAPDFQIF